MVWIWTFTSKRTLPPLNYFIGGPSLAKAAISLTTETQLDLGLRVRGAAESVNLAQLESVGELLQRHRPRTERKGVPA